MVAVTLKKKKSLDKNDLKVKDVTRQSKKKNRKKQKTAENNKEPQCISDSITKETILNAAKGLRILVQALSVAVKNNGKKLLDDPMDGHSFINMQVTSIKIPKFNEKSSTPPNLKVKFQHSLVDKETEVCLIVRDLERGIKTDHEQTIHHFNDLLEHHDAKDLVKEVMPLRQLKVEYKEFEAKRNLANRVGVMLCDDTIVRMVPPFLGKHFYKKKKLPIPVNLKANDLKLAISQALRVGILPLKQKGTCAMIRVGLMKMTNEQISDNVKKVLDKIDHKFPGGWKNIQSIYLKTDLSTPVPIYLNLRPHNEVENVSNLQEMNEPIIGELSTIKGFNRRVKISPDGIVSTFSVPIDPSLRKFRRKIKNIQKVPTEECYKDESHKEGVEEKNLKETSKKTKKQMRKKKKGVPEIKIQKDSKPITKKRKKVQVKNNIASDPKKKPITKKRKKVQVKNNIASDPKKKPITKKRKKVQGKNNIASDPKKIKKTDAD